MNVLTLKAPRSGAVRLNAPGMPSIKLRVLPILTAEAAEASQAEAVAGTILGKFMSPLRVAQAFSTSFAAQEASQAQAEAGIVTGVFMSPLRTKQAIAAGFPGSFASVALPTGAAINWNSGDVTLTHTANTLNFAGASSGYHFDDKVTITPTSAVANGVPSLRVVKPSGASAGLDIVSGSQGKAVRFLSTVTGDDVTLSPSVYFDNGMNLYSRNSAVISGHQTGSGDSYNITHPSADPAMLMCWSDVDGPTVQFRTQDNPLTQTRILDGLDASGNHVFSLRNEGWLAWGASTFALQDTSLSRTAAATLAVGNGTIGDFSGTLKLTTLDFMGDVSVSRSALNTLSFTGGSAGYNFDSQIIIANNVGYMAKDSGGTARVLAVLDNSDNLIFGQAGIPNQTMFVPGTGRNFRFLNAATSLYFMELRDSGRTISFLGNNHDSGNKITFHDLTATTGDTVIGIRDGDARAARLRFGTGGTYDVGFSRSAAGVMTINDGSTTLTNYRDLWSRRLVTPTSGELTIATGAITVTGTYHTVDTEADAASDDLATINGGTDGAMLTIRAADSARTVVAKDGTGNLQLVGDCTLDNAQDTLSLVYDGALSAWLETSRSDNGA